MSLNRLANTQNPFQGDMKKVLCVCSAGLLRSPTLAYILSNAPFNYNTRACGAALEYALIPITEELVYWADEIIFVEKWQQTIVENFMKKSIKPIHLINTPDQYKTRDPELIKYLTPKLKELFNV